MKKVLAAVLLGVTLAAPMATFASSWTDYWLGVAITHGTTQYHWSIHDRAGYNRFCTAYNEGRHCQNMCPQHQINPFDYGFKERYYDGNCCK